jgi:hypothetical protein
MATQSRPCYIGTRALPARARCSEFILTNGGGNALDLTAVRNQLRGLQGPLSLTFHPGQGDSSFAAALAEVADAIQQAAAGRLVLDRGNGADLLASPALSLCGHGTGRIHYLALPEGQEAAPFVAAVLDLARGPSAATSDLAQQLAALGETTELIVFVTSTCPHCPQAVRAANAIAVASPLTTTFIVDAQHFPDLTQRFSVQSVPLTVLDRRFFITGVVQPSLLAERILARGTEKYESQLFRSLLAQGRLDDATKHLGSSGAATHFFAAWQESTTSSRMGLLLVGERALAADPGCLDDIVSDLLPLLRSEDVALRGDTADLLGRIGHPNARAELTRLLKDPNPDVAEIAAEALEQLSEES